MATTTPRSERRASSRRQLASLVAPAGAADAFRSASRPAYLLPPTSSPVGTALAVVDRATRRLPNPIVLGSYPIEAALLVLASSTEGTWEPLGRASIGAAALGGFFLVIALGIPGQLVMDDPLTELRRQTTFVGMPEFDPSGPRATIKSMDRS